MPSSNCSRCGNLLTSQEKWKKCLKCGREYPSLRGKDILIATPIVLILAGMLGQWSVDSQKADAIKETMRIEQCKKDVVCWARENNSSAMESCKTAIEHSTTNAVKWADDINSRSFFRKALWKDNDNGTSGVITYFGDQAQAQSNFGAWKNIIYQCDYTPSNSTASATFTEGRL